LFLANICRGVILISISTAISLFSVSPYFSSAAFSLAPSTTSVCSRERATTHARECCNIKIFDTGNSTICILTAVERSVDSRVNIPGGIFERESRRKFSIMRRLKFCCDRTHLSSILNRRDNSEWWVIVCVNFFLWYYNILTFADVYFFENFSYILEKYNL